MSASTGVNFIQNGEGIDASVLNRPTQDLAANIDLDFALKSGTYTGLRAQATTAGDVGLGSVRNVSSYSQTEVDNLLGNSGVPAGIISLWSGSIASVPSGWALCDGLNGTPNLQNRFVVGAGGSYAVGATGGSADAVVVAHSHSASLSTNGNHRHSISGNNNSGDNPNYTDFTNISGRTAYTNYAGDHSHSVSINSTGESGTDKNLPPYYALAYIMKL